MASTSAPSRTNNLGPLTTSWAPPSACAFVQDACPTCVYGWQAQVCSGTARSDDQDCWPSRAKGVSATSGDLEGWGLYSPGWICPSGYQSVAAATQGAISNFDFQFPLENSETGIACCPTYVHPAVLRGGKQGRQNHPTNVT